MFLLGEGSFLPSNWLSAGLAYGLGMLGHSQRLALNSCLSSEAEQVSRATLTRVFVISTDILLREMPAGLTHLPVLGGLVGTQLRLHSASPNAPLPILVGAGVRVCSFG